MRHTRANVVMVKHKQSAEIGTWQIAKASVCRDSVNAVMQLSCSSDNTLCEQRPCPENYGADARGVDVSLYGRQSKTGLSHIDQMAGLGPAGPAAILSDH